MDIIQCEIIKDLMPLYVDQVCSDVSKSRVEEHLAQCNSCKQELDKIQSNIIIPRETLEINRGEGNVLAAISTHWNRSKLKAFMKGSIVTALLLGVIILGYVGLFQWKIISVPSDVVVVTDISQLSDGGIAYHFRLTDGYDLNRIRYDMDADGNFYMTPLRPVFKSKPITRDGLFNRYYQLGEQSKQIYQDEYGPNSEITALYLVSRSENILIWNKGMVLPAASQKVEEIFDYD